MGRSHTFTCHDCKCHIHVGRGSYTTWARGNNFAEIKRWMEENPNCADLTKNLNLLKVHQDHEGHNFTEWFEDYAYCDEDNIYFDYGRGVVETIPCKNYEVKEMKENGI